MKHTTYYGDKAYRYAYTLRMDERFIKYVYSDVPLDRIGQMKIIADYSQETLCPPSGLSVQKAKEGDDQAEGGQTDAER